MKRRGQQPVSHPDNPALADIIERNINTMADVRAAEQAHATLQDRLADGLTRFSGNMWFVYVHVVWFVWWIAQNEGWVGHRRFDPFPYGLLTLIVSLEAIFLSTFVLISQNRAAVVADMRADLDLQIDRLTEYEVAQLLQLLRRLAEEMPRDKGGGGIWADDERREDRPEGNEEDVEEPSHPGRQDPNQREQADDAECKQAEDDAHDPRQGDGVDAVRRRRGGGDR